MKVNATFYTELWNTSIAQQGIIPIWTFILLCKLFLRENQQGVIFEYETETGRGAVNEWHIKPLNAKLYSFILALDCGWMSVLYTVSEL